MHPTFIQADTAEQALTAALQTILADGEPVLAGKSLSVGSERTTRELCDFSIVVTRPTNRLIMLPGRRINLTTAIARFVWLVAGSDRARDIAYYDSRALAFSDDGTSLPGSNFGHRIFAPTPGLDQFATTIERLRRDPSSRRAAIAIFQPEDASRESRDIPCALSLTYRIRGGDLHATTIMRSSNTFGLFPYDFFEFSMLAEMLACELHRPLGSVTHFASSAHFYEEDIIAVRRLVNEGVLKPTPAMPPMPHDPAPRQQTRTLVELEWELRHSGNISELVKHADHELCEYWFQFFAVLCWYARREEAMALGLSKRLQEPFASAIIDAHRRGR